MRNLLALTLALLVCLCPALPARAEVDTDALEALPGMAVYLDDRGIDTVIRPMDQPFEGTADEDGASACAFIDFVEMAEEDAVFMRFTISVESQEELAAGQMVLHVGKRDWVFTVRPIITEYDMVYQEDYAVCLTDESLPMIKDIARSKTSRYAFVLQGDRSLTGEVVLSGKAVSSLYDSYVRAGGAKQDLSFYRDLWPVKIEK